MRGRLAVAALLLCAGGAAQAETRNEFWPEFDAYLKLSDRVRVFLLAGMTSASERRNAAGVTAYQDTELAAHLDITLTPIGRASCRERVLYRV